MSLVRLFRLHNRPGSEIELNFFRSMPSLELAIHHAGNALDWRDKRFGHQCRIKRAALRNALEALRSLSGRITKCRSFAALHQLLDTELGSIPGIGELYIYDTSLRLGAFLKLGPENVYMHTGTRAGAKALGLDVSRAYIHVNEFPSAIQALPAHEIEDFLCIYKTRFAGAA